MSDLNGAMGGGNSNQNQTNNDLGVRKADSAKIQSLFDDSENYHPGMNPYGMGGGFGISQNPLLGGGMGIGPQIP